ncbi:MAG: type II secretion system protein, partial [Candidatus Gastranaerophilaceae bacterium]
MSNYSSKTAFTLAEVLITLGIIGIVAALILPFFMANIRKNEYSNKLKKLYSIISQAVL